MTMICHFTNVSRTLHCRENIFELPCVSVSKRFLLQNLSYENDFDLHENETVGETHFHMNGFA